MLFAIMATCACHPTSSIPKSKDIEHIIADQIESVRKVRQVSGMLHV